VYFIDLAALVAFTVTALSTLATRPNMRSARPQFRPYQAEVKRRIEPTEALLLDHPSKCEVIEQ
jgi:hypothetical protein